MIWELLIPKQFTLRVVCPGFCTQTHLCGKDRANCIHYLCRKTVKCFTQGKNQKCWEISWSTSQPAVDNSDWPRQCNKVTVGTNNWVLLQGWIILGWGLQHHRRFLYRYWIHGSRRFHCPGQVWLSRGSYPKDANKAAVSQIFPFTVAITEFIYLACDKTQFHTPFTDFAALHLQQE